MPYNGKVPGPILAPVTHGVKDWAPSRIQRLRHVVKPLVGDLWCPCAAFVVAIVVLEVINAPGCVGLGVNVFVTEGTKLAAACVSDIVGSVSFMAASRSTPPTATLTSQRCCKYQTMGLSETRARPTPPAAYLETQGVDLVCDGLDAIWKLGRVLDRGTRTGVASVRLPT